MSTLLGTVLVVNDDAELCELLASELERHGYCVDATTDPDRCPALLRQTHYSVALADRPSWLAMCKQAADSQPALPVVIITGDAPAVALDAINAGAYDVVAQPISLDVLNLTLARAIEHRRLADEVAQLQRRLRATAQVPEIIGQSAAMHAVFDLIHRVSATEASVLLTGESGTGKELVARAIHDRSARRAGPFVTVNCAAVPPTMLESQLFGHSSVVAVGGSCARPGSFLLASRGTLYLDEIEEIPLEVQRKLVRVLDAQRVRAVGGTHEVPFDTRLISATDLDLESRIDAGAFLGELYCHVNVVQIDLPALRARGTDILLIAHHLIRQATAAGEPPAGMSTAAVRKLLDYRWPGNVRELQNCIAHAVAFAQAGYIRSSDLPERIRDFHSQRIVIDGTRLATLPRLSELQRRYILRVLDAVSGNKAHASRILGMDRRTLYRKLARLHGEPSAS